MEKFLIKTKHLGLRFVREEDNNALESLNKDPEVKRFFPEGILNYVEVSDSIHECLVNCEVTGLPCFVIFELKTKYFVGQAYFDHLRTGEVKVGYLFHKKYWSLGYATEVLEALLAWAKKHIDADYIVAYADKRNAASFRVMEHCGMKFYKKGYFFNMESRFYRIKNR